MKTCGGCLFYIFLCRKDCKERLIKKAVQYTKGRYQWTEKHEQLYQLLSDDDGVCLIKCEVVASDQRACRNYVDRLRADFRLQVSSG